MKYTHTQTDHPIENEYPKLVRDKIPEIVETLGLKSEVQVLSDDADYLRFLLMKLIEEATELQVATTDDNQVEELADVYEVLQAILTLRGLTDSQIALVQEQKRQKRGGFSKRLLMLTKP